MKIKNIIYLCIYILAFAGCSKDDDESMSSNIIGKWVFENAPDQFVYCYSDGGVGINMSAKYSNLSMCGTYHLEGNGTFTCSLANCPKYDKNLISSSGDDYDYTDWDVKYSTNISWLDDNHTVVSSDDYGTMRKVSSSFEYWSKDELVGVWESDEYRFVFSPDWKLQIFVASHNYGRRFNGGFLHVVNPEEKSILFAYYIYDGEVTDVNNEKYIQTMALCRKVSFEWENGHKSAIIGGHRFIKTSNDWKGAWLNK